MDWNEVGSSLHRLAKLGATEFWSSLPSNPEFQQWKIDALEVLAGAWGNDSDHVEGFQKINYTSWVNSDSARKGAFNRGLGDAVVYLNRRAESAVLEAAKQSKSIGGNDVDAVDRGKREASTTQSESKLVWRVLVPIVVVVVGGLLLYFLLDPFERGTGTDESGQQADTLSVKDTTILVDLRGWYDKNNRDFTQGLEELQEDQAARIGLESGRSIQEIIEYSEGFRLARDKTIDSFLVRVHNLQIDIDSLGIEKKLPVRLELMLRDRLQKMGLYESTLQQYRIDTL